MKGPDHEWSIGRHQRGEQGVLIGFAVHDVNRFDLACELCLDRVDASQPSPRFAEALVGSPFLVSDGGLEAKYGLESEKTERPPLAVSAYGQRKVPEETLGAGPDQVTETVPLLVASELELCRVVRNDDLRKPCRSPSRLAEVRRKNRVGCYLVVTEEPVGSLELGIIQRLREAFCSAFRETIH